ncbi:MAG: hypothetical protein QOD59_2630 [Mycobacterium sp.]|jgi:hypothetical protein|nr:hypothetical protein [Mycobacterium sp.]
MSSTAERDELNELSGALLKCVTALAAKLGDTPAGRRLVNDAERIINGVDRLDIDVEELELSRGHTPSVEMIQIPDTQYDIDFWRDVDHEGIGGQNGACAP